ncbi:MAG: hypothetical protein Q7S60_05070 [bacterium]|nr:hypothetical protein [bacterium]
MDNKLTSVLLSCVPVTPYATVNIDMPLPRPKILVIAGAGLIALVFVLSLAFFDVIPLGLLRGGAQASYACPIAREKCREGESFTVPGGELPVFALGFRSISSNTPIFAVIDGKIDFGGTFDAGEATSAQIIIQNEEEGLQAVYTFPGTDYSLDFRNESLLEVKKGQGIAKIGSGVVPMDSSTGTSYNFILTVQNTREKMYLELAPADFH